MSPDVLIGVDAGTSVIKAVAFDLDGNELAATGRANTYVDLPGGGAEQDMARTWDDTAAVLRDLALHVPDLARRTAGRHRCWPGRSRPARCHRGRTPRP